MNFENDKFEAINSYIFFALFSWIFISLTAAKLNNVFAHVFFIFLSDAGLFDKISIVFLMYGVIICAWYLVYSLTRGQKSTLMRISAILACVLFLYSLVFLFFSKEGQILSQTLLANIELGIDQRDFLEQILEEKAYILASIYVYIAFIIYPIVFEIFSININYQNNIGKILLCMRPSLNIVTFALFACSIQPFYEKNNLYSYIDLATFITCLCLFIFYLLKNKNYKQLTYTQKTNIMFVIVGILLMIICTSILNEQMFYPNMRICVYVFVFVSWTSQWLNRFSSL